MEFEFSRQIFEKY